MPNNLRYLSYWHAIYSADTCGNDFEQVLVNSNEVFAFDLCEPNDTNGWTQIVIDLSAYAGQSIMIQIRAECNGTFNSNLFIDHVGLQFNPKTTNIPPQEFPRISADSVKTESFMK